MCNSAMVFRRTDKNFQNWFCFSTMWVKGIALRPWGLVVGAFTYLAIKLAQGLAMQPRLAINLIIFLIYVIAGITGVLSN